jgi:SAM-dependent methyltransferase
MHPKIPEQAMIKRMTQQTADHLLALNQHFYRQMAAEFDRSRMGLAAGWQELLRFVLTPVGEEALWVLDAGCGNGRFARTLEQLTCPVQYIGLDASPALLARAGKQTSQLVHTQAHFVLGDLAQPGWVAVVQAQHTMFDLVVCLATLHHLPGYALRRRVVQTLASVLAPSARLILSNWQFLTSERFVEKQIDWQKIGLSADEVEAGDALLPWQQGGYAIRYVHQIDESEVAQLAQEAGLSLLHTFYADGKEGNLNLYTVLQRGDTR